MATRTATARWGAGDGTLSLGSGAFEGNYSFGSRFEDAAGTNPEELIGAALAGCFSMALSHALAEAGHPANSVETTARVRLASVDGGFAIDRIELETDASASGISDDDFQRHAHDAKSSCPVSKALSGVEITLTASLAG